MNTQGKKKAAVFPGREEAYSGLLERAARASAEQPSGDVTTWPRPSASGSAGPAEHAPVPGTISKTSGAAVPRGWPIERQGVGQLITLSAINATMGYRGNPVLWCIQAAICTCLPRPLGACCCRIGLDKWLSLSDSKQACPSPLFHTSFREINCECKAHTKKWGFSHSPGSNDNSATLVIIYCFPGGSAGKASACNGGGLGSIPGLGRSLEKGMATHSSILTWRIPWAIYSPWGPKELDSTEELSFSFWWLRWERICLQCRRPEFNPRIRKIPWRGEWLATPVFLPGEFHGQRSLAAYSPWNRKKSGTTERLTLFNFFFNIYLLIFVERLRLPGTHWWSMWEHSPSI